LSSVFALAAKLEPSAKVIAQVRRDFLNFMIISFKLLLIKALKYYFCF